MEFEDEHDEKQEIEEEDEEEVATPPSAAIVVPPSYDSVVPNSVAASQPRLGHQASSSEGRSGILIRYKECLKNYAVNIGGHSLDGCGEFMPGGEEGTIEALSCAACNCHRNFHRKEVETPTPYNNFLSSPPQNPTPTNALYPHFTAYYRNLPSGSVYNPYRPLAAVPATPGGTHVGEIRDDNSHPSSSSGGTDGSGDHPIKKRFRTKFTQEQKDRMLAFAERLGWRIQKQDEDIVQEFCAEIDVKRQVLKVWMHNNKHTKGKML